MSKRLAIVNHNLGSGGAEKLIYDMALELKKINFNFSIILLTKVNDIYGKKLQEEGIEVIYLSNEWDIYNPKNILKLKKILKNYDIIHTHTYSTQLWTAFVSLFLSKGKKYITTEHSTNNRRREKYIFKYLDKWMYSRYHKIISITKATQLNLQKWLNDKNEEKYLIINNGINLKKYYSINKIEREKIHVNLKNEDILICMIGRFSEQKDQKTLIKSMRFLNHRYKLILLGDGDNLKDKKIVKELGLEKRVYFLGYKSNVAEIVKSCDIAVLSSHWEGFGLAAVESMALGIPTIGSNVEGLKDILENGGLTFQKGDSKELATLISNLIEDNKKYNEISKLGLEKSKIYSLNSFMKQYLKIYKEV